MEKEKKEIEEQVLKENEHLKSFKQQRHYAKKFDKLFWSDIIRQTKQRISELNKKLKKLE